ncbi:MAG TPA: DNA-3-methyladenine glycosylase, partial [Lachnospiraceae bacterium]|nr:DNA-3-methyladenine glycosylase [Lachnospiraceae bacterium]
RNKPMEEKRLDRSFFVTDALELSRNLIGKIMVHKTPYGIVRGIITETEAYMGVNDKGSHTYGGKRTDRTEPMFHIGGTSYVYLIYGMYSCVNVTAGVVDIPMASLIRMVIPFDEESKRIMTQLRMDKLRKKHTQKKAEPSAEPSEKQSAEKSLERQVLSVEKHLADGPGKLCIAMHITKADNNMDLSTDPDFYLTEGITVDPSRIQTGKRIGIDYAEEAADYLWRFTLT